MTLSEKNCLKNNWLEGPLTIQLWQWHESLVEITDDGRGPFPTSSRSLRASLVHVQSTSQLATPTISIYLLRDRTCIYKYSRPLWWYTRFLLEWTSPARLYCTNATTKCWTHATCRRQEYTLACRACDALHVWRLGSHALPHTQARTPRGRACWQEHFLDANCRPDKPDDHLLCRPDKLDDHLLVAMQRHFSVFYEFSSGNIPCFCNCTGC